ncbi:hypothetical protein MTR67_016696 [Solanum verrucosum]|uniref:Uncharacterized protein n=1 Tax=Solanum verrucosum TaxID=315347 RepID=A0AAF0QHB2_SOLVR|nr:hypothetical protein MTR67_016696 [Solanum verrucosum]
MYTNTQDCKSTAPAMAATGASTVEWPTRSPLDSTVQTGNANGDDWHEKVYEKIKSMKEMYVSKLYRLYQKITYELQLSLSATKAYFSPVQEQLPQSYMQLQLPQPLDGQTNASMQPVQANLGTLQQNSNALQQSFPKKRKQQTVAEPAIKRAVPPSADAAATFLKTKVNATAASKATVDHAIANPPDVTASTVFDPASATTIP